MSITEHIAAERMVAAQHRMRPITQRVEQTARKIGARYHDDRAPVETVFDMIGAVAHDAAAQSGSILPQGYYPDQSSIDANLESAYARGDLRTPPTALVLKHLYSGKPLRVDEALSFMLHRRKRASPYAVQHAHIALLHWLMDQGALGQVCEQLSTTINSAGQHEIFQTSYGNARDMLWHYLMLAVEYSASQVHYFSDTPWRWQTPLVVQSMLDYIRDMNRWKNLRELMLWTMPRTVDRINKLDGALLSAERQNDRQLWTHGTL